MPPHSPGLIAWLATPGASKSPATPRRKLASLGFGAAARTSRVRLVKNCAIAASSLSTFACTSLLSWSTLSSMFSMRVSMLTISNC